jgi:hypothetical protein
MDRPGINRRRMKRRSLTYYILVLDASTHLKMGHLLDITPIGLMMDSPKPLPVGKDFNLRLDTTPEVADTNHITFTARSKWCRQDPVDTSIYNIGFSIEKITPHDARIIERIVERFTARETSILP